MSSFSAVLVKEAKTLLKAWGWINSCPDWLREQYWAVPTILTGEVLSCSSCCEVSLGGFPPPSNWIFLIVQNKPFYELNTNELPILFKFIIWQEIPVWQMSNVLCRSCLTASCHVTSLSLITINSQTPNNLLSGPGHLPCQPQENQRRINQTISGKYSNSVFVPLLLLPGYNNVSHKYAHSTTKKVLPRKLVWW